MSEFLTDKLNKRGWSMRELARRSGNISHTYVADVVGERTPADADFCIAVARPLGYAPEEVLRIAGFLPPLIVDQQRADPLLDKLVRAWGRLYRYDKIMIVRILEGLAALEEERAIGELGTGPQQPFEQTHPRAAKILTEAMDTLTVDEYAQLIRLCADAVARFHEDRETEEGMDFELVRNEATGTVHDRE